MHLPEIDNIIGKLQEVWLDDITVMEWEEEDDLNDIIDALGLQEEDVIMESGDKDNEEEWLRMWI